MALRSSKAREVRSPLDAKLNGPSTTARARKHEDAVADDYGGRRKGGSGASMYSKGDVAVSRHGLLFECKTTDNGSYRLDKGVLTKITREARGEGKDPAMEVEINGIDDPATEKRWVVIPASVFQRMLGE